MLFYDINGTTFSLELEASRGSKDRLPTRT
jgi:hypothetical protein